MPTLELINTLAGCSLGGSSLQPVSISDINRIRSRFPALLEMPELLFFDNASTTQKPASVIQTISDFYYKECANAGRASYSRSTQLAARVEASRNALARLLNADPEDIAFTNGATDSLNTVAIGWGLANLQDGDEIMLCPEDHQSAVLPWLNIQGLLKRQGIHIRIVAFNIHPSGTYDRKSIQNGLSSRTRLIALSHVHHLYGMEMDIPELKEFIPDHVLISLDASQSIGHTTVNIEKLGAHFVSFSGHKMFAANGTGVLWVAPQQRRSMAALKVGSKTSHVVQDGTLVLESSNLAGLVECGTLNLPGILSFVPAVEFINSVGQQRIEQHVSALTHHLHNGLKELPGIEFAPGIGQCNCTKGFGIISFKLSQLESTDLAAYLESEGALVRSGDHCQASRTADEFVRVSLHIYNTIDEVDRFVEVLQDAAC